MGVFTLAKTVPAPDTLPWGHGESDTTERPSLHVTPESSDSTQVHWAEPTLGKELWGGGVDTGG